MSRKLNEVSKNEEVHTERVCFGLEIIFSGVLFFFFRFNLIVFFEEVVANKAFSN